MATIAVYGATGYTGKLVCAELARRGVRHLVVGRDPAKLAAVAASSGAIESVVAPAVDAEALQSAFTGANAVINCAGPFVQTGERVVAAAIAAGAHYVDTTGEQRFMRTLFADWSRPASDAGVVVVPGMGFDYMPGDLICHLAAQGHEPLRELVLAYAVEGFGMTRGTMRSSLSELRGGDVTFSGGQWVPAGAGPRRATFEFPPPIGRRAVGKYPCGEILTVPRHVRTAKVTARLTLGTIAPRGERIVPYLLPAAAMLLRTPLRGLLSAAIARLPEGPPEEERRGASFTIVAVCHGEDGSVGRGVVRGSDVYGLTAASVVHGALLLCEHGIVAQPGVLAPAEAFDAASFLQRMGEHGVSYELSGAGDPVPATA